MCINSDNNHGFAISGKYPQGIALIDCENLTSTAQLAAASRWMGFGRVELFGRAALLAPWRVALTGLGVSVAAETLIADDAPTQAADQAMARRVDSIIAQGGAGLVAIASNDKGFDADMARLAEAGIPAMRCGDLTVPETLALVVRDYTTRRRPSRSSPPGYSPRPRCRRR